MIYLLLLSTHTGLIFLVADMFHPVSGFAVGLLHNRDVCHAGSRGGAMPMFFSSCKPDHIPRSDLADRAAPALRQSAASGHDQGLPQRMTMPGCPRTGFECDAGAIGAGRI